MKILFLREAVARERVDEIATGLGLARVADPPWTDGVRFTTWKGPAGHLTFAAQSAGGTALLRVESDELATKLAPLFAFDEPSAVVASAQEAKSPLDRLRAIYRVQHLAMVNGFDAGPALSWLHTQLMAVEPPVRWAAARALSSSFDTGTERALDAATKAFPDLAPENDQKHRLCAAERDGTLDDGPTKEWWELVRRSREGVAKGQWKRVEKATEELLAQNDDHGEGLLLRALAYEANGDLVLSLGLAAAARAIVALDLEVQREAESDVTAEAKLLAEIEATVVRLRKLAPPTNPDATLMASILAWIERWAKADHWAPYAAMADSIAQQVPALEALALLPGHYHLEVARLTRVCQLAPDSASAHHALAGAQSRTDRPAAIESAREALALVRSQATLSSAAGQVETIARAAKLEATEAGALHQLTRLLYDARDWTEAAMVADELVKVDQSSIKAWQMRANALTFALRHEEALAAYDDALREIAKTDEAGGSVLLGEDPRGQIHFNRSCVLARLGHREPAFEALRRAVRVANKYGKQALADDSWQAFQDDPELAAIAALDPKALILAEEKDPSFVRRSVDRALGLSYQGRSDEAIEAADLAARLGEAIARPDLVVEALSIGGRTMAFAGDADAGLERLEKALALAGGTPDFPAKVHAETLHARGVVLHAAKRFEEAARAYDDALALRKEAWGGDHPVLAKSLGDLARLVSDRKEPKAEIDRAMQLPIDLLDRWLAAHTEPCDDRIEALIDLGTLHVNVGWQELESGSIAMAIAATSRGIDRLAQALREDGVVGKPLLQNAADLAGWLVKHSTEGNLPAAAALRDRVDALGSASPEERRERAFWHGLRALWQRMHAQGVDGAAFAKCLGQTMRGQLPDELRSIPELASLPAELARRAARQSTFIVTSAMALQTAESTGDVEDALTHLEELCVAGLFVEEDDS